MTLIQERRWWIHPITSAGKEAAGRGGVCSLSEHNNDKFVSVQFNLDNSTFASQSR